VRELCAGMGPYGHIVKHETKVLWRDLRQKEMKLSKCSLFIHFLFFYICETVTRRGATMDGHDGSAGGAPGGGCRCGGF
jgi:hypothetical protein